MMQPTFITRDPLYLLGMSFYGDPFQASGDWEADNEIGRVWQRFMGYFAQQPGAFRSPPDEIFYEVHLYTEETTQKGFFEVFVGVQTSCPLDAPPELLVKGLPAGRYAVFTLAGEQITADWSKELERALAGAGVRRARPYIVQVYDRRFKGTDRIAESEIDVWIPVEPLD